MADIGDNIELLHGAGIHNSKHLVALHLHAASSGGLEAVGKLEELLHCQLLNFVLITLILTLCNTEIVCHP